MKKTLFILFIYLFSGFCCGVMAQNLMVQPEVTIIESSNDGMILRFTLNDYRFDKVETPRGTAYLPVITGKSANQNEKGEPDLPSVAESIIIPDQGNVETLILESDFEILSDMEIAPSKGAIYRNQKPADVPYVYGDIYEMDEFFPNMLCKSDEPYIMRDVRGTNIQFYPFVYNAMSKELKVYKEIVVEIKFNNKKSINEIARPKKSQSTVKEFNSIYDRLFLNASTTATRYTPLEEKSTGKLLIIAADSYADAMTDYINWKREKGIDTEMVLTSEIGYAISGNTMKNYIQNRFDEDPNICYFLLVGDGADIPPYPSNYGDSDYYYVRLVGTDQYADAFIGRFSGNKIEDIETQVERTIYYEKYLNQTDTWLEKGFGSASAEGAGIGHNGGESDEVHMNNIKTDLEDYGYIVTLVNQRGGSNAAISDVFNGGAGIANYTGHGDVTLWSNTNYNNSHVNALTNNNKLPFIWSTACLNGDFRLKTCFAEAWLRATNNTTGAPTGAIAFLGSTINQLWRPPMDGQDEMVDILVESYTDNIKRTIGGLSFNGIFKMIQTGNPGAVETAYTWVLFGDPSLTVRTKTPSTMTIDYPEQIIVGSTLYEVKCDTEGALVCLSEEDTLGNVTTIRSAYVIDGIASLSIAPAQSTEYKLTITAFNKETIQELIYVVVADDAYIIKNGQRVDDSEGNSNGIIEYGENIKIYQSLKNVGIVDAVNVSVEMKIEGHEDITISNNPIAIDRIGADSSYDMQEAFVLDIPKNIQDNTILPITLTITDEDGKSWTVSYSLEVYAPQVQIISSKVDDTTYGDGNKLLSAGERATVFLTVQNDGTASLLGNVKLRSKDAFVTIINGDIALAEIKTGENNILEFEIQVNENFPVNNILVDLGLYFENMDTAVDAGFPINLAIENWESQTFLAYEWDNTSDMPWIITSDEKYEGDYSVRSGLISHRESSILKISMNIPEDGVIEFYKKVSTEPVNGNSYYDYFAFSIDGTELGKWAGETDWSFESFAVEAGTREFKWEYKKDFSMSSGQDCAWLDRIQFPRSVKPAVSIGAVETERYNNISYPNPSDGNFNVEVKEAGQLRIIDLAGKVVYECPLQNGVNPISTNLSKGVYMIQVITKDTKIIDKIIIK